MIECRGRNGWFNLYEASTYKSYEGRVAVQMRSKSPFRDMPPIFFAGPREEVLALLNELKAQVEED
ncbi:MAG: hypothetical protein L6277_03295 [Desulfobacterales bacterium]|nr:hypothetical protein [Pseudomonadota bacterium]MCG2771101.1 hypothetical protein [Desulfobacterales bacterium]